MAGLRLKNSFTFPYRWLTDPEDRKFLQQNLINSMRGGGLKEIMATSGNDPYYADFGEAFVTGYFVRLKTHAYQPVPIPLTQAQVAKIFKDVFPGARCIGFETFFVQSNQKTALPLMEIEIYHQ